MLTKTGIDPETVKSLLKDENYLLLGHLSANYKPDAEAAKNFLVAVSGKDFNYQSDKWRQSIKEN